VVKWKRRWCGLMMQWTGKHNNTQVATINRYYRAPKENYII